MTESKKPWYGIVSLFPELCQPFQEYGVIGKAYQKGLWDWRFFNPRRYAKPPYYKVDDHVYGGGPGVVLMIEPVLSAIHAAQAYYTEHILGPQEAAGPAPYKTGYLPVVYLSPQGPCFHQATARAWALAPGFIFLSGRYEGIDERLVALAVDQEISIGHYVLCGGELPLLVILEALLRLRAGTLGHPASALQDSFARVGGEGGLEEESLLMLDCPHYTRPEVFEGLAVPPVLRSGDHQAIAAWRQEQSRLRTQERIGSEKL